MQMYYSIYQAGIYIADRADSIRHNMQGLEAKGVFSYLSYICVLRRRILKIDSNLIEHVFVWVIVCVFVHLSLLILMLEYVVDKHMTCALLPPTPLYLYRSTLSLD